MSARLPNSMVYRICVYKSKDEPDLYVAHCLELDLTGVGSCVESALAELLENIDTQRDVCEQTGAQFFVPAPTDVWKMYISAAKAGRRICGELSDRVMVQANKRIGHQSPFIETIVASKQVPDEFLAMV